jgi:hypothetical protein
MESLKPIVGRTNHMAIYNDIFRAELKFIDKRNIVNAIGMITNISDQASLISKLLEFKYYRQDGVNNEDKQKECWAFIEDRRLSPPGLKLRELMVFIKNDGYIFRDKIPQEFKELLLKLGPDDRQLVLSHFADEERPHLRHYLTEVTGKNWDWIEAHSGRPCLTLPHYNPTKEKSEPLTDQKLKKVINNYPIYFPQPVRTAKDTFEEITGKEKSKLVEDKNWLILIGKFPQTGFTLTGNLIKGSTVDTMISALNQLKFDTYYCGEHFRDYVVTACDDLTRIGPFSGYVVYGRAVFDYNSALLDFKELLKLAVIKKQEMEKASRKYQLLIQMVSEIAFKGAGFPRELIDKIGRDLL